MRAEKLVCVSDAVCFLDYSLDFFIKENFLMMFMSKGGLMYSDLCNLPFDLHQKYLQEADRIQKLYKKQDEKED